MFPVLLATSIAFIIIGIILSILTVRSFFSRNMAEVYDALYDRGYVEKLERRKNKKNAKNPVNNRKSAVMDVPPPQAGVPQQPQVVAPPPAAQQAQPQAIVANGQQIPIFGTEMNSGNTTVLTNEQVNVGANNEKQSFEFTSGQTTLLSTQTSSARLTIVKDLYYIASNETMQ